MANVESKEAHPALPPRWATWLASQPETGMGYHVIEVVLQDGRVVTDVAVVNGVVGEVKGHAGIPFDPQDIVEARLTHNRWSFRRR